MSEAFKTEQIEKEAAQNRKMVLHRTLFGYACDLFTHAPIYLHWKNFLAYIRRFRTITIILRVSTVILTILETGALVILSTAVFLVILPVLTALMLGILLTALLESKRSNRTLDAMLKGKNIYVLFLSDKENSFLFQNAKDLAKRGTVLLVSPYWISPKGLRKGAFYCTVRREGYNIFLIRRYYFFSLRKHVLSRLNVAYLY